MMYAYFSLRLSNILISVFIKPWNEPICWTVKMLLQLELNMSRCHNTNEHIKSVLLHLIYKRHETSKMLGN